MIGRDKKYQRFTVKMTEINNDAFNPVQAHEVARLLRQIANRIEDGQDRGKVKDFNGNTAGEFYFRLM